MFIHGCLRFEKLEEDDLPLLRSLKGDSWLSTHQVTLANASDQTRWFESLCHNVNSPRNLVLVAKMEHSMPVPRNTKIGIFKVFDVDYVNRTAQVGWDIFCQFRGKGLGKCLVNGGCAFCFDILALRRLTAEILTNNVASLKCAQAAGFVMEGTKRQAVHRLGEYIDSAMLGLLLSDRNLALQPRIGPV